MNETGLRRLPPEQLSGSGHTFGTSRLPSVTNPILSKRVCFYKSGDPQFNGLRMVINNRTFKTFDALLDSLSKKVPLPFGVRNITTPRGVHTVSSLDELEDGKSYICSDHRKVKPINLAMARKKPPPWYHARPVSSRRRTVQQGRLYPGNKLQESVVIRTPKKLLIFRNGDPSTQCGVVLQKRSTSTFESILRYISELMQFRVAKLHTPDGRRVDGLPALIMCSGTVVAAGREKFKPANYNSQKSVQPKRNNRRGVRRLKALNRKKRSFALKPRLLSPSSERYIVNQIHNSIAESAYSIPTNSHEMESSHMLESVAESEENFLGDGAEGQDSLLPTDDDIEKSFRVNQDGSMTVEMKVRLTIKEEETIHWTTTLSRSSVSNQLTEDCLPAPEPEQEISLPQSDHTDLRPPTAQCKDLSENKDFCNEDPTSLNKGSNNEGNVEEDDTKKQEHFLSHLRSPTPGQKQVRTKQASVESVTSLTADGLHEDIIGSYFREHIENGDITEQYCMVKHTNSRPVPKPRRVGSVEANSCSIAAYKTAGLTEILQRDSSGEEVKETVMHIYEQQTCQDNFLANVCSQAMSTSVHFSRPATCDTGHDSFNCSFQPEPRRPSTASEPTSLWRSESISLKSDLTFQSQNTGSTQPSSQRLTKSQIKEKAKIIKKERKSSPKHKVKRLNSPGNKSKQGTNKKGKPLSSARFISKIYGSESKPNKDMIEMKKSKPVSTAKGTSKKNKRKSTLALSDSKAMLAQQATLKPQKERTTFLHDTKSVHLPLMSNSGTNGYVEDWLEKAQSKPCFDLEEENQALIETEKLNLENDPCLMSVAEKVKCLKEKSKTQDSTTVPLAEFTRKGSVRQKIKSFESKSEDRQQCETNSANDYLLPDIKEGVSISNNMCSKNNLTTLPADKSATIVVQFEESSNSLLMDLPPPPPESLLESFSAHVMEASASSSPLYRLSSVSDIHPLSTSPTSDRVISPTDRRMEMVSSIQADNSSELRDAPLQRAPSIKRAPLVSNLSLERKMSLKKACLDEYTIPKESISLPIHTVTDHLLERSTDAATERMQSNTSGFCEITQTMKQSNEDSVSPKLKYKKVKLVNSPSPERKKNKKPSEIMKKPLKTSTINNTNHTDKKASLKVTRRKSTSPSASPASEKKEILSKSKRLQKSSPYSQSLDLASPPVKQKASVKSLQRNLSTDSALAPSRTPKKMPSQRRTEQGLNLKQSNKTNEDKSAQIQGSTRARMEENTKAGPTINVNTVFSQELVRSNSNQPKKQELDKDILDAIKTNDNEAVTLKETSISNVGQEHNACEVTKKQTEHLLAVSKKCEAITEMLDSQCYADLKVNMEVPNSVDDTSTDIDELSFSEEDVQTETKELMVIVKELLSDKEREACDDRMSKKQLTENDVEIHLENDSGNDNSSCDECIMAISTNYEITSIEEEVCSDENEMKSEEETAVLGVYIGRNQSIISQDEKIENIAKKLCEKVISQSVAEGVTCLEDNDTNGCTENPVTRSPSQNKVFLVSDGEECPTDLTKSQVNSGTRSAPQSSLSFSYDSSSVITKQPEGNRVKSIREMFLAKSATDTQLGQKHNLADKTEFRAETSISGGYQSQTSSELSSGEDDSSRKSISKGFVMKTIERLYGKKESLTQVDKMDRPLSAHKQKKKDQSIFSPFHAARSKTVSELSYFNSSNALDTLTEATKCIAFNAQVVPGDSVLNNHGGWLLHDNTVLRKSVSDPVAISQNLTTTQEEQELFKDTEEKTPYLLFKTDSEEEQKSPLRKCTYFSLPHASDSEAVQEESVIKGDVKGDCCESKDNSEGTTMRSEKNGKIPGVVTDFKIKDNKVHPLVEMASDGEAIVVQPLRGQGVLNKRLPEPDMMDFLYNFCGEHCPIL